MSAPGTALPIPTSTNSHAAASAAGVLCVTYTPPSASSSDNGEDAAPAQFKPQQPVTQNMAKLDGLPQPESITGASAMAANPHFGCYAVKKGLIRVLHRQTGTRTLLRAHQGQRVTDLQFFHDGAVLATVASSSSSDGGSSKVIIWRVFDRGTEIGSEIMLEIASCDIQMTRVIWHPFNANQFWMMHTVNDRPQADENQRVVATLVESTRINSVLGISSNEEAHSTPHPVADFHASTVLMDGATVLDYAAGSLQDLAWSSARDTRYVLTGYSNGEIVLWDLKQTTVKQLPDNDDSGTTIICPSMLHKVCTGDNTAITRCLFLPHEDTVAQFNSSNNNGPATTRWTTCFVTGSDRNRTLTFWSACGPDQPPQPLQVVKLHDSSDDDNDDNESFLLSVSHGSATLAPFTPSSSPPSLSCFVTACSNTRGRLYALHCRSQLSSDNKVPLLAGCDRVLPFGTPYAVYSVDAQTVRASGEEDEDEEERLRSSRSNHSMMLMPSFDVQLFAYQSAAVQVLTLTASMLRVPSQSVSDDSTESTTAAAGGGAVVTVERLWGEEANSTTNTSSAAAIPANMDFEEYDVDDEDDDYDADEAPDPSSLPSPLGVTTAAATAPPAAAAASSSNPFNNWLGAIAAKTTGAAVTPPPPTPAVTAEIIPPPPPPPAPSGEFLSPMDILRNGGGGGGGGAPMSSNFEKKPPLPAAPVSISGRSTPVVDNTRSSNSNMNNSAAAAAAAAATAAVGVLDHAAIADEVRRVVREEVRTTVLPTLRQAVTDSVQQQTVQVLQPLQASIDALAQQGVQVDHAQVAQSVGRSVHEPLRKSFADSMKTVLIPTLESVTGQVFQQVSDHLEKNANDSSSNINDTDVKLDAITNQLATMSALVVELTNEVQNLQTAVAAANRPADPGVAAIPAPPPVPLPVVDPAAALRQLISTLLAEGKYEEAFTKAVSENKAEMTVFCCRSADLQDVLGGNRPALSQPILLCLMQQLGTVLAADPDPTLELEWLQEIALSLNPADPSIQRHVPGVLQQVVNHINQRMAMPDLNPALRRPLQRMLQVVRGVQMG